MNIYNIIKRSYYSVPPNAFKILNKIRLNSINNLNNSQKTNPLYANQNTNCYDYYNIVKKTI